MPRCRSPRVGPAPPPDSRSTLDGLWCKLCDKCRFLQIWCCISATCWPGCSACLQTPHSQKHVTSKSDTSTSSAIHSNGPLCAASSEHPTPPAAAEQTKALHALLGVGRPSLNVFCQSHPLTVNYTKTNFLVMLNPVESILRKQRFPTLLD